MLATWGCTTFPKPTLSLDFLGATSLDSGITFSRGSQATLFDSTGTLVYAKHNLLSYSEDFADATWSKDNATVNGNAAIAPNGTLTADKLITNAAVTNGQTFRSVTLAALTTFTFSCFAKAGEWSWTLLATRGPENLDIGAYFNLSAGTVGTVSAGVTASITPVGDGWYRCAVTRTTGTGATASRQRIYSTNADNTLSTGDGTSGIFIWGAQLNIANMEGGVTSSLSTYYPTTTAAYYAPRFDYNPSTLQPRGLLIEEQRTNSIRNNTMQGAVAGTPGTLPTNWLQAGLGTLTREIVGTGTDSGITYIDIRYSGTTSTTVLALLPEGLTQIVAASGQTWTSSFYLKLQAGSTSNITSISNQVRGYDAGGIIQESNGSSVVLTSTLTRFSHTYTLANAGSVRVVNALNFNFASGVAIDITLRIGLPQLEQGAFATSVIPTTTTALTRNADVATMTGTNFSSWYNQTEGTFVCGMSVGAVSPNVRVPFHACKGTSSVGFQFAINANGASSGFNIYSDANTYQGTSPFPAVAANSTVTVAGAYKTNDSAASITVNGVTNAPTTDTSVTLPTSLTQLTIGAAQTNNISNLNGYIQRIAYYPTRLPNTTLQALTA